MAYLTLLDDTWQLRTIREARWLQPGTIFHHPSGGSMYEVQSTTLIAPGLIVVRSKGGFEHEFGLRRRIVMSVPLRSSIGRLSGR